MKIRRFNESISNVVTKEYIEELFLSFADDLWDVTIDESLIINNSLEDFYDDINSIVGMKRRDVNTVNRAFWATISREYDRDENAINSVESYSEATDFFTDFKSKLQTLEQDGLDFYVDEMNFGKVSIAINANIVLLDKEQVEKLGKLKDNGCTLGHLLGNNKISIGVIAGNNTKFSRLYGQRVYKSNFHLPIDKEFESWFDENFKIESVQDPDGDGNDYYSVLVML